MLNAVEATGVKGLIVAMLGIFDTDGSAKLSREEFGLSASALGYEASPAAWQSLCNRFGLVKPGSPPPSPEASSPDKGLNDPAGKGGRNRSPTRRAETPDPADENLDLGLISNHFANKYDTVLEGVLRQIMGGLVHTAARVSALEETMEEVHGASIRDRERKMEAVMRRWQNGILSVAFEAWSKLCAGQRELLQRTARHWANGTLAAVWRRWREMIEEVHEQRRMVAKTVGRMRMRVASLCFEAWKGEWEDVKRQWATANKAVQRMKNRQAAVAFETWHDAVETAKAHRAAVRKVLGRIRNREIAVAFEGWHQAIMEAKDQRQKVARTVGRMMNRVMSITFEAWKEDVQATVRDRKELLRKIGNRVMNRTLALSFERWKGQIDEQKEQIARAKQLAARMLNGLLGKCFDGWTAFATEQKRIMRRAAYAIGPGRILSVAYFTWAEHVREILEERAAADMEGLIDARLAANINAYLENKGLTVEGLTSTIQRLERTVERLPADLDERMAEARLLEEAYLERRKFEAENQRQLEEAAAQREAERERDRKVQKIMRMWKYKMVAACFDGWAKLVRDAKETLARAGGAWRNIGLAGAWRKWVSVWELIHQANAKKIAARAQREREQALLNGLRSVGATWFQEMQLHSEVRRPLQAESHASSDGVPPPSMASNALVSASATPGGAPSDAEQAAAAITTMLDLMDERYVRMGTGARGGQQLDRDLRLLETRMAGFWEQCTFFKQILANIVKDPTILSAVEKSEHEQPNSPRAHRPLRAPPQFAFEEMSVEQIEKMMDSAGAPARWLRSSQSRVAGRMGFGGTMGASAPTLAAVRDPRKPAGPPGSRHDLQTGGASVSSLNGLLQERLGGQPQPRIL